VPIAGQALHARFALQEGQGIPSDPYPPMSLRRVVPTFNPTDSLVQVFDAVGCFEASPQLLEQAEPVKRERLL